MGWQVHVSSLAAFILFTFQLPSGSNQQRGDKVGWLEGLRGFVTMLVYMEHSVGFAHENVWSIRRAYGWRNEFYIICLPGIRLLFSGGFFAVAVFFAISGYVISIYPLRMLYSRDPHLCTYLGAAIPRRWMRLFFPVICTTFLFMTSWHILGIQTSNPTSDPREPTYIKEVAKWVIDFKNETYFFKNEAFYQDAYNPHIWSIATEFRGSLVIYICMLISFAFVGYGHGVRLLAEASLIFYTLFIVNGWYIALFTMGMLLCDLDLLGEYGMRPSISDCKPFTILEALPQRSSGLMLHALLALSIYLAGVPHTNDRENLRDRDPGWHTLASLAPPSTEPVRWFFLFWAATLAMICIPRIAWLKAFFESGLCQYLGKISFGIYLIHGPILWTVGDRLYAAVGRPRAGALERVPQWVDVFPLPDLGPLGLEVNAILPQVILLPLTSWLAGIVTTSFDKPGIKLSRWLFKPPQHESYMQLEP